jgi:hypothetical protein
MIVKTHDQLRLASGNTQSSDDLLEGNTRAGKCKNLMTTLEREQ